MGAGASAAEFDSLLLEQLKGGDCFCPVADKVETSAVKLHFLGGSGEDISAPDEKLPGLPGAKSWFCKCFDDSGGTWDMHVLTIPSGVQGTKNIALLLHSFVGKNRCSALFAEYCPPLVEAGYDIVAIDYPGYGRSCDKLIPARSNIDGDLVLAVLKAFGAEQDGTGKTVTVVGAGGGCGTFAQLYVKHPKLFGGHHVFHNPVMLPHPDLGKVMLKEGCDIYALLSEGWDSKDYNCSIVNCKQFFDGVFKELGPERIMMLPLRWEGSISAVKGDKPGNYLMGCRIKKENVSKEKEFYVLQPSKECIEDIFQYLKSKRPAPVKEPAIATAPTQSALELGTANENFRVFIRVRPMLSRELSGNSEACVRIEDVKDFPRDPPPQRIHVEDPSLARVSRGQYVFDKVFMEKSTQQEVFKFVAAPLIHDLVKKQKNVTMFAYGQTGTGKTYTMEGPTGISGTGGLVRCSIELLFDLIRSDQANLEVSYQYVQLYGGDWLDLLSPQSNLEMKVEEMKGNGNVLSTRIKGATIKKAGSAEEILSNVEKGASHRASGATNMNNVSSRSHAILIVFLSNNTNLYMIDLAGSERNKRSGASGQRMVEATSINVALSALGRVVINLVEKNGKRGHVSYLDNPLTHLLMPGLGGNSKTALISCITSASDSLSESIQTLRFSVQASHVKNKVDAKDVKDQAKKADNKIAAKGNDLVLNENGKGEVPVQCGENEATEIFGFWKNDSEARTIIFIHDFKKKPEESYGSIIDALKQVGEADSGKSVRVLAPTFHYESEKVDGDYHSTAVHKQLLAIMDYLGIPKATVVGQDLGGVNAVDFQLRYKARTNGAVAQNKIIDLDAKGWKKACKRDPSWAINCMMNVWNWFLPFEKEAVKKKEKYFKKFKGPCTFLWPFAFKGRAMPKGNSPTHYFAKKIPPMMKGLKIVDSYNKSPEELAKYICDVAKGGKKGGKKKGKAKKN